jgi:hypothetical protein
LRRASVPVARPFFFKIDFHGALTVLAFAAVPLAIHKVTAIAVHFSDRRLQVMHIAFDFAVHRIFGAVLPSAILPALALVPKLPGGHYVFPLNPAGAVFIFTHFIAAGLKVNDTFLALPVNFTATVEITWHIAVNFYTSGFGLGKTFNTFGQRLA